MRRVRNALVALFIVLTGQVCAAQPIPPSAEAIDRMLLIAKDPPQDSGRTATQSAEPRLRLDQLQTKKTNLDPWRWFVGAMCFHLFAVLAVLHFISHPRANAAGRA